MSENYVADRTRFREAMSRLGAAVNIITTKTADGQDAGFTASAVCSVTDTPPTLLVCVNKNASLHDVVKASGILCVNVLAHEHEELSPVFASVGNVPMAERFAMSRWLRLATGAPALETAAAKFICWLQPVSSIASSPSICASLSSRRSTADHRFAGEHAIGFGKAKDEPAGRDGKFGAASSCGVPAERV
jgi:flavin reductase